jgi:protein translocase SecG subunit
MNLLFGFLTFVLVVNCLFLMLLVLVQLPKKEAGAGLAFGAGAVDTLIGAGSGNALTKLTKYSAASFLGLAVALAMLNAQRHEGTSRSIQQELQKKASAAPVLPVGQPAAAPVTGQLTNNTVVSVTNSPETTATEIAAPALQALTNALPTVAPSTPSEPVIELQPQPPQQPQAQPQ